MFGISQYGIIEKQTRYTQLARKTFGSTTVETSFIDTTGAKGDLKILGSRGDSLTDVTFIVEAFGYYTKGAAGTFTLRLKLGTQLLWSQVIGGGAASNAQWYIRGTSKATGVTLIGPSRYLLDVQVFSSPVSSALTSPVSYLLPGVPIPEIDLTGQFSVPATNNATMTNFQVFKTQK